MIKTITLAVRGYIDDELNVRASALTYSVMFAVIPILALFVALGKGFGFESMIRNALQQSIIGQYELVDTIMDFVERYLQTAQGGVFVGIGVFVLIWAVYAFFHQIEVAFNSIWQVKKSRSYVKQFTTYFAVLLLLPLLLIASSGFSIYLNHTLVGSAFMSTVAPIVKLLLRLIPYVLAWIMFTVLYVVIPNTHVKLPNGIISGVLAGTAFMVFQQLYIWGQVYLSRYNVVYGSFAAIPLLLMFIQISCLIVLLGAEICYASQNVQNFEYETDTKHISRYYKDRLMLFLTYLVVQRFEQSGTPLTAQQMANDNHLPIRLTNHLLERLVESHVLIEVFNPDRRIKAYQPSSASDRLRIIDVIQRVEHHGTSDFIKGETEQMRLFFEALDRLYKTPERSKDILVRDIVSCNLTCDNSGEGAKTFVKSSGRHRRNGVRHAQKRSEDSDRQ
ncbi:MAG: YihY/virulence factor BrkB family protein [Paludibacteraceae bacterium]|nr:YihY/virulence factor BrkB family protein [Paludibacteraceae bacterium]